MIASMTGFARREAAGAVAAHSSASCAASITASWMPRCDCPTSCRGLEPELRQALARGLKRGKVDCTVTLRGSNAGAASLEIDEAALERCWRAALAYSAACAAGAHRSARAAALARRAARGGADPRRCTSRCATLFADDAGRSGGGTAAGGRTPGRTIEQRCGLLTG